MTGNQVVSTVFDFSTCNHMVRFVLWVMGLKTLDIVIIIRVAMEYVLFATHRSTVYVSWLCRLDWKFVAQIHSVFQWLCYDWHDYMDPQCMIGGHEFCLWRHQSMIWVWECLPQNWYMYDTLLMLDVCRSPSRCAFGSWHTHTAYKVYRLSLVPLSDFGGHSVIHIFGYRNDDMIMTWWWKI